MHDYDNYDYEHVFVTLMFLSWDLHKIRAI
jgi:hypothetical protein